MKKPKGHVHKYERAELGSRGHIIYKCVLTNCPHYLPQDHLIVGKLSLCIGCNEPIEVTREMFLNELKHPICLVCREARQKRKDALAAIRKEEN